VSHEPMCLTDQCVCMRIYIYTEMSLKDYDADGDGVVTLAELRDTLTSQSRQATQKRLLYAHSNMLVYTYA